MYNPLNDLINKIRAGKVVLWAGSGLSLYAGIPGGSQLCEEILKNVQDNYKHCLINKSLADMSQEYEEIFGRTKLLNIIKSKIDIVPKNLIYHNMLTEIPQIKTIITTNYDNCFETAYDKNLYKIVSSQVIPYSNKKDVVKLYKIHGDFSYSKNIILTKEDYSNFYRNMDSPLWNNIKSIISKYSILFVGYSLEDSNIEFIFDNIKSILGKNMNMSYLVVPNLLNSKINKFRKKNIEYINMKGEELITKIYNVVRENLIIDCVDEYIKPKEVIPILQKNNLMTEFSIDSNGTYIKNIKNLGNNKYSGSLLFKPEVDKKFKEKLEKLAKGQYIGSIKINLSDLEYFHCNVNGIKLPELFNTSDKSGNIIIETLPTTEYKVILVIDESDRVLKNVLFKRYKTNYINKIEIKYYRFILNIYINVEKEKIEFKFKNKLFESALEGLNFTNFLLEWFNGKNISVIKDEKIILNNIGCKDFKKFDFEKIKQQTLSLKKVYINIIKIEEYYKQVFKIPERISKNTYKKIETILNYIDKIKIKGNSFKTTLVDYKNDEIKKLIDKNGECEMSFYQSKSKKIKLFNKQLELGIACVKIPNAIIQNQDSVLKALDKKESKITLILISKTDKMIWFYKNE